MELVGQLAGLELLAWEDFGLQRRRDSEVLGQLWAFVWDPIGGLLPGDEFLRDLRWGGDGIKEWEPEKFKII